MSERPAPAFFLSAALHGAVVVLCLLIAYVTAVPPPVANKVFELVAGEGSNYAATAAPALGVPDGSQIKISAPELAPLPMPPVPLVPAPVELAPVEATPIQPAPTPVRPVPTHAKAPPAVPDFSKSVARTANRTAARIEAKEKRKELAEAKKLAAQKKQISYAEYLKEHGAGIAGGVVGGSVANKEGGAGGKALTREDGSVLEAYFKFLEDRLRESFVAPPDASDSLSVHVTFFVSANGSISNLRIDRESGNAAFDEAVRAAFHEIRAGVGARPDHRGDDESLTFSMKADDAN